MAGNSDAQFLQWFDLMGLQRHIKVLGIFARLWLRDGKPGYLHDLPLVLHYTLTVAARYPRAAEFVEWMEVRVLPACRRQPWWQEIAP
jgi:aminoglycoside/choline kinase family phosphotransferase